MSRRKNISFIVEPFFMCHHVGVRNYLYSLYNLLSRKNTVELVSFYRSRSGVKHWYRLVPKLASTLLENSSAHNACLRGTPKQVLRKSQSLRFANHQVTPDDFYYSHIGSDLSVEDFDVVVITNPWLVDFEKRFPCRKLIGMVYDTVPNEYVFTRADKPYHFASNHQQGFLYYREHCDSIIAISEKARVDYYEMFKVDENRVFALPPILPPSYDKVLDVSNDRSQQLLLASPFDLRKGLAIMPSIINSAKESVETLSIYGGIRCTKRNVQTFFRELQVKNVEWYPNATSATVQQLFSDSKVMLFPSFDEGLGMPILESQFCGCRTMVRDKPPMNLLTGPGHYFISDKAEKDGEKLREILCEPFDHRGLQLWAQARFGYDTLLSSSDGAWGELAG